MTIRLQGAALAALLSFAALGAVAYANHDDDDDDGGRGGEVASRLRASKDLREAVTVPRIRAHQLALQIIAAKAGGNRLASTLGHDLSAEYVARLARRAGYNVSLQEFEFFLVADATPPVLAQVSPEPATYPDGVAFATMDYSGSGDTTAALVAVDLNLAAPRDPVTSGCEAADFAGFPSGAIALVQRGTCPFRDKAVNAVAAGAAGVIIMNQGNTAERSGLLLGTLGEPPFSHPVVGTTFALGETLSRGVQNGPTGVTIRLRTDTLAELTTTRNVIAESRKGDPTRVVVVGAHLDSVDAGPGINDNGSGSAVTLEIALQIAGRGDDDDDGGLRPRNRLRFIWFSAEEQGLIGSARYVASLSAAEQANILGMLNFDMVGSPNFVRFVYDGDNSAFPVGPGVSAGPPGSGLIESLFVEYFGSKRLASAPTAFDGRSDYGPFIAAGIPAGGLFTGAGRHQDPRAGGGLRRHRGNRVRPVLPPRLRHVRQQQQHRPWPDGGRGRARSREPRAHPRGHPRRPDGRAARRRAGGRSGVPRAAAPEVAARRSSKTEKPGLERAPGFSASVGGIEVKKCRQAERNPARRTCELSLRSTLYPSE
jgi:Zn-dependent M28 family amino/carboxypeptidase